MFCRMIAAVAVVGSIDRMTPKNKEAIDLAKTIGTGCVGCRDSNHFAAAAPYVLMACRERLIGIVATNAFPTMPLGRIGE